MPRLIVTDSAGVVTEHEIGHGSASIGRSSECEVVVLETEASRKHAVVEYDGEKLLLRDQASHNGTWLNGERIAPGPQGEAELSHGDEIRIGATVLKVAMEEPADAAPAGRSHGVAGRPGEAGSGGAGAAPLPSRPVDKSPPTTGGPEEASGNEEATKDEAAWKVGDGEVIEDKGAPEEEAKERGAKERGAKGRGAKRAAKKRASRRETDRETTEGAAPSGRHRGSDEAAPPVSETARTTRRRREIFGGMRLSQQQQTMVKIASFGVIVISLIGVAWMLNYMSRKPVKRGRSIVMDPRAEPERLAEEACALARQARTAEDTGDIREALRLISEAKEMIEEADRLYSIVAEQYQDKGPWRGQVKSRQIKTQAYGIRTQHFRLDMQVRREEGRL